MSYAPKWEQEEKKREIRGWMRYFGFIKRDLRGRRWEEMAVAYCKVLSRYSLRGTEETHEYRGQ
jgi:hypothetical protein